MNQNWEIRRVSTPERIFNKIKTEMAQPVGIVLFGAGCDFKNEVQADMMNALGGFACYYTRMPDTATMAKALKEWILVVTLNSDESAMHELRHELVEVMRNAGAKTVVGIYAKATRNCVKQISAIEQSNPTADGLDYFIVVEEKGE